MCVCGGGGLPGFAVALEEIETSDAEFFGGVCRLLLTAHASFLVGNASERCKKVGHASERDQHRNGDARRRRPLKQWDFIFPKYRSADV